MDNLYRVQQVNPELAGLLRRLKTIYAITGGEVHVATAGKKDDFQTKKSILIAQLHNFEQLCETKDTCSLSHDSRDYIRLKNTVNIELGKLTTQVDDLKATLEKELHKSGSKMTADEVQARREVMQAIVGEFRNVYKKAKGHSHAGAEENSQGATGINLIDSNGLMKGDFRGAGVKTKREELTGEQQQQLELLRQENQEQDVILDEMSKVLDELKEVATQMGDELQAQEKILEDLSNKADNTQKKLDAVNDRMKDAVKMINDKATNFCVYIICIVILLGLAMVAYNMIKSKT